MKTPILLTVMGIASVISSCQKSEIRDQQSLLQSSSSANGNASIKKKGLAIGDYYGGGIIIYIDETGKHGLISATEDIGPAPWGCYGTSIPADFTFTSGQEFANKILTYCNEPGIAARLCDELVIREKGDKGKKYSDWYMPDSREFDLILRAANALNDMNFTNSISSGYWLPYQWDGTFQAIPVDGSKKATLVSLTRYGTSTDVDIIPFIQVPYDKTNNVSVRPIRAF
jgi:hypothetical protein